MKSFQQFQEDLNQLQRDLNILDKKRLQKQRLISRRKSGFKISPNLLEMNLIKDQQMKLNLKKKD